MFFQCRGSLVDKQFGSKADRIYCGPCYDAQFASRCDACGDVFKVITTSKVLKSLDVQRGKFAGRDEEDGVQEQAVAREMFCLLHLQEPYRN